VSGAISASSTRGLHGTCRVPGDKSISHRAALLGSLAPGPSVITGFSPAGDCRSTLAALRRLGAEITVVGDLVEVGAGLARASRGVCAEVDCGRSGTTMRLLAGIVASTGGEFLLTGHPQLLRRPMGRVAEPLRAMGAVVELADGGVPPMHIRGAALGGITYTPAVASAQVKSAILLAGLSAVGATTVVEAVATRDHTERLLAGMGARISVDRRGPSCQVRLEPGPLTPLHMRVPGDASSAAVIAAAAALVPGSDVLLAGVSANATRTGFLRVLEAMGAQVETIRQGCDGQVEPVADFRIKHRPLNAVRIGAEEVPFIIDELPLVGLLATQATGTTEVVGAQELRVKESDRIRGLVEGLRRLGADAEELPDGFVVRGRAALRGGVCDSMLDHRLAMTFSLAGLIAEGPVEVSGLEFVDDSFPGFLECLGALL